MTITVTQEHIDKGIAWRADSCPIALALREQVGPGYRVGRDSIYFGGTLGARRIVDLPGQSRQFVKSFDNEGAGAVQPFSFDVELENKPGIGGAA